MESDDHRSDACMAFMQKRHYVFFEASRRQGAVLAVHPTDGFVEVDASMLEIKFNRAMARDEIFSIDASVRTVLHAEGLTPLRQLGVDPELSGPYRPNDPRKLEHTRVEIAFPASSDEQVRYMARILNKAYDDRHRTTHKVEESASRQLSEILGSASGKPHLVLISDRSMNQASRMHP